MLSPRCINKETTTIIKEFASKKALGQQQKHAPQEK
jgi:hypothetical protein